MSYVCPNDHPMPVVVPVTCEECDARVTYEPAAKGLGAYRRGYDQAVADQTAVAFGRGWLAAVEWLTLHYPVFMHESRRYDPSPRDAALAIVTPVPETGRSASSATAAGAPPRTP